MVSGKQLYCTVRQTAQERWPTTWLRMATGAAEHYATVQRRMETVVDCGASKKLFLQSPGVRSRELGFSCNGRWTWHANIEGWNPAQLQEFLDNAIAHHEQASNAP